MIPVLKITQILIIISIQFFSGDAENINIFDASDKNITEEFVLKNANKERQEIINEFAYGGYTLVVNDKIEKYLLGLRQELQSKHLIFIRF